MSKTLMVVGAGLYQLPAIIKAKEMGYKVVANDIDPNAIGLECANYKYNTDIKDIDGCIKIAHKHKICGVLTVAAERAVRTVASIANSIGLPGLSLDAAEIATDKSLMREQFEKHGVPSPVSHKCWSLNEADTYARKIGFPVVIKPADNAGSRGVSLVESFENLSKAYNHALSHSQRGLVLVEEFMPGVEISVELFVYKGKVYFLELSDKIRTPPPYLLDTTVVFPSDQPDFIQSRACEVAQMAINATGIDMATVHMELMITKEGVKVVELAARGAGFHVFTDMVPWVTGVDVVEQLIKMSVGEVPDFTVRHHRGSVLKFPMTSPGLIKRIEGFEEAKKIKGISVLEFYVKPGDFVRPLTSGSDRIGHIISMAETRTESLEIIKQAENIIKIEVEKKEQLHCNTIP